MQLEFLPGLFTLLLVPILILIHCLRHKPVKKQVTTLFIWESVLQEQRSAIYFQGLLKNISLLLQILIIGLLALALSKPVIFLERAGQKKQIIIMDTSASMNTLAGQQTRFEKARQASLELAAAMSDLDSVMIIAAGASPEIVQGFTRDKVVRARAIQGLLPSDTQADLQKAVYLALSFFSNSNGGRIYLVTDGAGVDLSFLTGLNPGVVPVIVKGGDNNQAIVNFTFRRRPGTKKTYDLLVRLKNFSSTSVICPLTVQTGSRIIYGEKIGLEPGGAKTIVHSFEGDISHYLTARIRVNDDLSNDNQAFAVLKPVEKTNVFLVSEGNYFIERLLSVMDNVNVSKTQKIPEGSWETITGNNHVIILDNVSAPLGSTGNFVVINKAFPGIPMTLTGRWDKPGITGWNGQSAITANVNFEGLYVASAQKMQISEPMVPLLESSGAPLISQYYDDKKKAVLFGFDLNDSDLPLRVAFPVLMKNIFNWLHPVSAHYNKTFVPPGTPFDIQVQKQASPVAVRHPSGKWEKSTRDKGLFLYPNTRRAGLYKIRVGQDSFHMAVNQFSEEESNINALQVLDVDSKRSSADRQVATAKQAVPLWRFMFLFALLLGIIEAGISLKEESPFDN